MNACGFTSKPKRAPSPLAPMTLTSTTFDAVVYTDGSVGANHAAADRHTVAEDGLYGEGNFHQRVAAAGGTGGEQA